MVGTPANVKISRERQDAKSVYYAEVLPIEAHISQAVSANGDWLVKPEGATHVQLQAISNAIRYTIDESVATDTHGFQLGPGEISSVPCPLRGISVFREDATFIQAQWFR